MDRVRDRFGQDAVIRGRLYERARTRAAHKDETTNKGGKPR